MWALRTLSPARGEGHADLVQQPGPVDRPHLDHRRVARTRAARPWPGSGRASPTAASALAVRLGDRRRSRDCSGARSPSASRRSPRASTAASGGSPPGRLDLPLVDRDARRRCAGSRCARRGRCAASSPAVSANRPSRSRSNTSTRCEPPRRCARPRAAPPRPTLAMTSASPAPAASRGGASGWWCVRSARHGPGRRARSSSWARQSVQAAGPGGAGVGLGERAQQLEQVAAAADGARPPPRRSAGRRGRAGWPGRSG